MRSGRSPNQPSLWRSRTRRPEMVAGAPRRQAGTTEPSAAKEPVMNPATSPLDLTERLATEQRARQNRLAALWQMTIAERVAAMRRGELTYEQLAAWTARHRSKSPPSM